MNLTIEEVWKYPLELEEEQTIELPYGSMFLNLIEQNDLPTLYALVNPATKLKECWQISLRATGQPISGEMPRTSMFIGTVSTLGGKLIWHLWLRRNNE